MFETEEYEAVLDTTEVICVDDDQLPYSSCQETGFTVVLQCYTCKAVVSVHHHRDVRHHRCEELHTQGVRAPV